MAEMTNTWEAIREGTSDVERLIGQKQYNLAMIKARQTLEIMVRTLAESNGIQASDLATAIDELYRRRIISQTAAEHYHRIRMIGNKAAHEGDDNPSGANTAYHLLSQELYSFAKDFSPNSSAARRSRAVASGYSDSGYSSASGARSSSQGQRSGSSGSSSSRNREIDERSVRRASHRTTKKGGVTPELLFIIMVPIVLFLIIFGIIKFVNHQDEKETETEPGLQIAVETTAPETEPPTTIPVETEPETVMVYTVIPEVLNVRSEPSKDSSKLGQVHEGETLSYISDYDDEWALINYNDQEGYVNKQYVDVRGVELSVLESEAAAAAAEGEGGAQGEEAADAQ